MLFTSYQFILFVLIALILYYVAPKRIQWIVLLCMNMLFYLYAGLSGIIFIVTTIITTYAGARLICREKDRSVRFIEEDIGDISRDEKKKLKNISLRKQKMFLTIVLFINFGILAVLKYTNMFIVTFTTFYTVDFVLPMGISFYTFQSTGYMIDVYRGVADAEKNPFRYALFVSFFPQLVQGPISRWNYLKKSLLESHAFSWINIQNGFERILWGYFKKMVIADRAAIGLATIQSDVSVYYGAYAFVGMLLYAIDLYADFTGGIDITIGVAQMFGITLPENFRRPFFSKSIAEYWRRWHISLGDWLKNYLFYPLLRTKFFMNLPKKLKGKLGKKGAKQATTFLAMLILWFTIGYWHGGAWTFIIGCGLLHWFYIVSGKLMEPLFVKWRAFFHIEKEKKGFILFQRVRTFFLVMIGLVFFRSATVPDALRVLGRGVSGLGLQLFRSGVLSGLGLDWIELMILALSILFSAWVTIHNQKEDMRVTLEKKPIWLRWIALYALLFYVILLGKYGPGYSASEFIYQNFKV